MYQYIWMLAFSIVSIGASFPPQCTRYIIVCHRQSCTTLGSSQLHLWLFPFIYEHSPLIYVSCDFETHSHCFTCVIATVLIKSLKKKRKLCLLVYFSEYFSVKSKTVYYCLYVSVTHVFVSWCIYLLYFWILSL